MTITATDFKCWRDVSHEVQPHPTFFWPQCVVCGAAPAYHDRPRYIPDDFALGLYVPKGRHATIKQGSGIVGLERRDGVLEVYYEGFIYSPEIVTDAARWKYAVLHAAGRQITQYPTTAAQHVETSQMIRVGLYYPTTDSFTITDRGPLVAWINDTHI